MNERAPRPRVFGNRFADAVGPGDIRAGYDLCSCFDYAHVQVPAREVRFHGERQDTSAPGWLHMLMLIDEAAAGGREVFRPLAEMSPEERRQVITLPPSVGKLTDVKHLVLYRSNLVRLPPEIGAMVSLEVFEPYTSPRLHWFPYELTRCANLKSSTVSTRLIFGNFKYRPPFPALRQGPLPPGGPDPGLWGPDSITSCSVCGGPVTEWGVRQAWLSARVATDVLPLLVNACSDTCVGSLPPGAEGHVRSRMPAGSASSSPRRTTPCVPGNAPGVAAGLSRDCQRIPSDKPGRVQIQPSAAAPGTEQPALYAISKNRSCKASDIRQSRSAIATRACHMA